MKNLTIIAGGKSPEHDVSIVSAGNIVKAVDTQKYKVSVIGISKNGQWYLIKPSELELGNQLEIGSTEEHKKLCLLPFDSRPIRFCDNPDNSIDTDIIFPITHGVFGEDGTLQGLLEHLDLPYVGPGVLGSSVGMDKDVTKKLLKQAGIAVTPGYSYCKGDNIDFVKLELLGFPLFVKPANMGSAVGVEKVNDLDELKEAIQRAFEYDIKILIEKGIVGREVETAVIGNLKTKVSGIGEVVVNNGFYTYENKYINDQAQVIIPAENFESASVYLITQTALKAYRELQLEGLSRIDFFYVSDTEYYLNEVNTLPGFTNISMFPKLWQHEGLDYTSLITELVELAEARYQMRKDLKRNR